MGTVERLTYVVFAMLIISETPTSAVAQDLPAIEFSGGYQWSEFKKENTSSAYPLWYAETNYNLNRMLGLAAQFSGGYDHRTGKVGNEGYGALTRPLIWRFMT